jgi:hypothetical protein
MLTAITKAIPAWSITWPAPIERTNSTCGGRIGGTGAPGGGSAISVLTDSP